MATTYDEDEDQAQTTREVVKAAITAPAREPRLRVALFVSAVAAALAFAPDPVAAAGAACLTYVSFDLGRRLR